MPPATDGFAEGDVWEGGGRKYRMEKVVGNGAFGIVWRAREEDGREYAIKKVVLDRRYHNRELEMMKKLDHESVIKLHHHFEKPGRKRDETYLHLVMDFLPETIRSVALQYQKQRTRFPIDHVRVYLYQTLKALEYVHAQRICHRDLKPDNLLVDPSTLKLKLIDFGCAKILVKGQPNVSYICSRYYRAPELMFGASEYTCAVDMWSIGTILVELLLGHLPFQGQDSTQQHLVEIMKLLGTPSDRDLRSMRATCVADDLPTLKAYPWERVFPSGTPARAMDLARKLLNYDPPTRLTAPQALAHPFFHGAEAILEGRAAPRTPEVAQRWQRQLAGHFDHYIAACTGAVLGMMPRVEASLQAAHAAGRGAAFERTVLGEVGGLLRESERAEQAAYSELHRKATASTTGSSSAPLGNGTAGTGGASADGSKPLAETAAEIEKLKADTADAKEEAAALRATLEALEAQVAAALAARRPRSGSSSNAGEAGGDEKGVGQGRRAGRPSDVSVSASNAVLQGVQAQAAQGAASPIVPAQGRPSLVDEGVAEAASSANRPRRPKMDALAEDDLGLMTPLGATSAAAPAADGP